MSNDFSCSLPNTNLSAVSLGHGSGGKLSSNLIAESFLSSLGNSILNDLEDASIVNNNLAVSTDSFVVKPIFFPGGDIGSLSIHGTINDLAMRGAKAQYIACGFILEEGFLIADLNKIINSIKEACQQNDIKLIAADTKVVNKGTGDKIFITVCGFGQVQHKIIPSVKQAKVDDVVIVSGDIARHGMAIMALREEFELESTITSDTAALYPLVNELLSHNIRINTLRDITRGGLATVLNEIAKASCVSIEIDEAKVLVNSNVQALCEMLGIDPLYVACEGRFVAIVDQADSKLCLSLMHKHELGKDARIIGRVFASKDHQVIAKTAIGGTRLLDTLIYDQLPRIC